MGENGLDKKQPSYLYLEMIGQRGERSMEGRPRKKKGVTPFVLPELGDFNFTENMSTLPHSSHLWHNREGKKEEV